jgi:hypothetical protein
MSLQAIRDTFTYENLGGAAFGAAAGAVIIPAFLDVTVADKVRISAPLLGATSVSQMTMAALIGASSKIGIDFIANRFLQKGPQGHLKQRDSLVLHVLGSGVAYSVAPALFQEGKLPGDKLMKMLFSAGLVGGYAAQALQEDLSDVLIG